MSINAHNKKSLLAKLVIGLAILVFIYTVLVIQTPVRSPRVWGVTFSHTHATTLGLEWRQVFEEILDELGVRHLRLPIYWSEVARTKGSWDFDVYDYQIARAEEFGAKVILAIGRKTPRWPECNEPAWVRDISASEQQAEILRYIEVVVERYRGSSAVVAWQVENEPFLPFGECPPLDVEFFDSEIALVRKLDSGHPVVITDSGELSMWVRAAKRADIFGTTMYRTIYNKRVGQFTYPLPPNFFRAKRTFTEKIVGHKQMVVIELQAEPWGPAPVNQMSAQESALSMDFDKFRGVINYASQSGFDEFYLWGVEWWYWQKSLGNKDIWEHAKTLFKD